MKEKHYIICISVRSDNIFYAKKLILDNNHIIDGISFILEDKRI